MKRVRAPLYTRWRKMLARCYDETQRSYHRYGGRGLEVCEQWREDYKAFEDWSFASGFEPSLQLDRIDNDKGYSPDNCRWVTPKVNANNKSDTLRFQINDEWLSISEASSRYGVSRVAIKHRIKAGLTGLDLIAPVHPARERGPDRETPPFCKHGHPFDTENTRYRRDGSIRCRKCELLRDWKRRGLPKRGPNAVVSVADLETENPTQPRD